MLSKEAIDKKNALPPEEIFKFKAVRVGKTFLHGTKMKIGRVKDRLNTCKVSKFTEYHNLEVEYIPNKFGDCIEICQYRSIFDGLSINLYVEEMVYYIFNGLKDALNPDYLKVKIIVTDPTLTPRTAEYEQDFTTDGDK